MRSSLENYLEQLHIDKKTGILNIILAFEKNLFKFYFKEGEIYHISYKIKKGMDSLRELFEKEIKMINFIPDVTIDIENKGLPNTKEIIEEVKKLNLYLSLEQSNFSPLEFKKIKEKITLALIKQIGPIGNKVIDRVIKEKWNATIHNTKEDLIKLIGLLVEEIEDPEGKKEFQKELEQYIQEVYK